MDKEIKKGSSVKSEISPADGKPKLGDVCETSVRYSWGIYTKLERYCKHKAQYIIKARLKHNGAIITRKVCAIHKKQTERETEFDHYMVDIISIENIA